MANATLNALGALIATASGLTPDGSRPYCEDCGVPCIAHKGHWVCAERGCPSYGESFGDGAEEDDDA